MPRGAPIGNKNSKGKGRHSAYQEKADAEALWQMWNNPMDREEIRKKLTSGKFSLKDVFISKGFSGSERVLTEIFRKLFPDKLEVDDEVTLKIDV